MLSGYFLGSNELLSWLWDATQKAIDFVNAGGIITNPEDIIKAINNCDKELAKEILEDYNIKIFNYEQV